MDDIRAFSVRAGSLVAMRAIFTCGGVDTLNYGQTSGKSPLSMAAEDKDTVRGFQTGSMLIDLGADVNRCITAHLIDYQMGANPLWIAAEVGENKSLIQRLILNGAKIYIPLSSKGRTAIDIAVGVMFERVKLLRRQEIICKDLVPVLIEKCLFVIKHGL